MESIVWAFLLRLGQAAIEASLTLVIGVITAGILRRMVTPAGTRTLFGRGVRGLFRGWLAGMLLPVCSLGVIPVAREMRRSGVPGGTILAFVLSAPLLNPISFLYGLTLSEPKVILCFAGFSLVLSTAAGYLWDSAFALRGAKQEATELAEQADLEPVPAEGPRRVLAIVYTAAKELSGRDLLYYLIGILGTALLSSFIPKGALERSMLYSDPWSPLLMTALAVPIFCSPLSGMMKIGLMFDHGNSIGAAFVLFALGIGTSLGTLAWLMMDFGWRRVLPWFLAYVLMIVGLGYLSEPILYDTRKAEADHTHAFDDYSSPYTSGMSDLRAMTLEKLGEKFGPLEQPAVYAFGVLLGLGLILRRFDCTGIVESWLTAKPSQLEKPNRWDIRIPGPILGVIALLGLVALSVTGAYVYYPDRAQCLADLSNDRVPCVFSAINAAVSAEREKRTEAMTRYRDEAIRHLEQMELVVRKLEIGVYLRSFRVTAEQSKAAEELRQSIEVVRDFLRDDEIRQAHTAYEKQLKPAYDRCKAAFKEN